MKESPAFWCYLRTAGDLFTYHGELQLSYKLHMT